MNSEAINTGRNPDLVTTTIRIDGVELSNTFQLLHVTVHKEVNRIPMAKLIFSDGDVAARDFHVSNLPDLMPGNMLEIFAGYHSDESRIFKGIIIKHQIKVKASSSMLIVECKDKAVKMTVGRKSNTFHDMRDSEAIESILSNYALEHEVESSPGIHKKLVHYHATDWDFMVSRAQSCGFLCFVSDGIVKVSKPETNQESLQKVTLGSTILDFDAQMDARDQYQKVTAQTWDEELQELVEWEKTLENISLHGNFRNESLAAVIGLEKYELKNGANISDELLQAWSQGTMLFQELAKVRGRVKFQGIGSVLPNTCIELEGVGDRFSGKAWVSGVFHQIHEGNWTVDVQFGLNPEWFSESYPIHASAASGLLPAIKGLHIGVVSQLQSDDGDEKILVKIPIITSADEGLWCRIASLDAGKERGIFFRPEIGDEVVVGFLNEDPNQPIVLGSMHSASKPAPIEADDSNHEKGIFTRENLKILFNDATKTIRIETPKGKQIILDEDENQLMLQDEHGNQLTMNSEGIQLTTDKDLKLKASGDLVLEGMNITVDASAQAKLLGAGGAEISSSAATVVQGSIVQIN
ncbi:type VI secretion system tip protein VgrG [Mongoliitalea daihaiensis]|uniref:type VI secretion system tip protein VgrG n=1 Tax=Mongoliitalea daihaiensis TaxID=2782006 RepID=UPI001F2E78DE|nr:type VI secretion system tip protein VgrG [Mongoliitalea daihaiensis]UJP63800.1 type VI secretion system tip protein VgrG [Mongoliitalea daihaiensis]